MPGACRDEEQQGREERSRAQQPSCCWRASRGAGASTNNKKSPSSLREHSPNLNTPWAKGGSWQQQHGGEFPPPEHPATSSGGEGLVHSLQLHQVPSAHRQSC